MSLNIVISLFSSDDYSKFISFLSKKNRRTDVKNIQLFKLLYSNELSSKEIQVKLYPTKKKDAYHALRKRLYDSLIDFLATTNLEEDNSYKVDIIKYILVARSFFLQQQFVLAFKLLQKAELIATEYQLYVYLNEIYHLKIQFSYANDNENLEQLIVNFKKNQQLYIIEEELNIVYAKIRQLLHQITYKGEVVDFNNVYTTLLNEQNISINDSLSFKSLYQILTIASVSAFITKDYLQIESFMLETYDLLKGHPNKEKEQFYHIQVLYMISNTLFRTKQFHKSMVFLRLMRIEIGKNKRKYQKLFKLKQQLLTGFNLNYTNQQDEAIALLEATLKQKNNDLETSLDVYLALIVFLFQKNDIEKAYKLCVKLYHTDTWYTEKVGKEWVIKKNLIELLLLIELDYPDLFDNRLTRFKRNFSSYLKEVKLDNVLVFLKHVTFYYQNPKEFNTDAYFKEIEDSFGWVDAKREDIIVMSFYAWLKGKMINKPVYEVTLHLIEHAKQL